MIGINQQIKTNSGGGEGVGFAVPVDVVKRSLGALRERFGGDTLELLELIKPAFVAALRRGRREPPGHGTAPAAPAHPLDALSERELAVVRLASLGLRDKAIAQRLGIGFTTVRSHLGHAFRKLGVANRTQLAERLARRAPDLPLPPARPGPRTP